MDNYWQGLWDQEVPKGGLKVASISLALNSPWKIKATKDHFGRIGFQLIADNLDISDDIFKRDLSPTKKALSIFKYKYYFKRSLDIFSTIIVTDFLIKIFANNNILLFPLRRISFLLLNNFFLMKKIILNHMTKSLIFSSIK